MRHGAMTDHEEESGGKSLRSLPSQSTDPTVSTEQTQIHKIIDDVWDSKASLYKSDNNCIRKPNNKLKKKIDVDNLNASRSVESSIFL